MIPFENTLSLDSITVFVDKEKTVTPDTATAFVQELARPKMDKFPFVKSIQAVIDPAVTAPEGQTGPEFRPASNRLAVTIKFTHRVSVDAAVAAANTLLDTADAEQPSMAARLESMLHAPITVALADEDKRPDSFMDEFNGDCIRGILTFTDQNEFLLWWLGQVGDDNVPEAMWYYVLQNGAQICAGAIDPYDIQIWRGEFGDEAVDSTLAQWREQGHTFDEDELNNELSQYNEHGNQPGEDAFDCGPEDT